MSSDHTQSADERASSRGGSPRDARRSAMWRWIKRVATLSIVVLVAALVIREARHIEWQEVGAAVRGYAPATLAVAFALSVPAQAACAAFDLVGRHITRHHLPVPRVMLISYTGYFFSLNLGALVGGLAFRYRLYVPHGLSPITIGQVITHSVVSNWTGYVLIAGLVLVAQPPELPAAWGFGSGMLRGCGAALLIAVVVYVMLCMRRGGSRIHWRGHDLKLPTPRTALVQFALSLVNWASIGAILAWLLPGDIGWWTVMPVVMVSAIAGIWSHVPSGLGVTEMVFVTLLGHRAPASELLAAILVFRVVYYLIPFAAALMTYLYLETTAKRLESSRQPS